MPNEEPCCDGTCATPDCGRGHMTETAPNGKHIVYCKSCRFAFLTGIQDNAHHVAELEKELDKERQEARILRDKLAECHRVSDNRLRGLAYSKGHS